MSVSEVGRHHGAANLLFRWRKQLAEGGAAAVGSDEEVVGVWQWSSPAISPFRRGGHHFIPHESALIESPLVLEFREPGVPMTVQPYTERGVKRAVEGMQVGSPKAPSEPRRINPVDERYGVFLRPPAVLP